MGSRELNSGPSACLADTLLTEPSHQSKTFFKIYFYFIYFFLFRNFETGSQVSQVGLRHAFGVDLTG